MPQYFELPNLPIRITARGDWLHGDEPLHPRVAVLFAKNVVPRLNGTYDVVLGHAKQTLQVQDTAYFVRSIAPQRSARGDGLACVTLWLSDGTTEKLQPETLMQSPQQVLYCRLVRHGLWVPCRFLPQQYHSLMLHACERQMQAPVPGSAAAQQAQFVLPVGNRDYDLKPYDPTLVPVLEGHATGNASSATEK
jgi:hypothetical protein